MQLQGLTGARIWSQGEFKGAIAGDLWTDYGALRSLRLLKTREAAIGA